MLLSRILYPRYSKGKPALRLEAPHTKTICFLVSLRTRAIGADAESGWMINFAYITRSSHSVPVWVEILIVPPRLLSPLGMPPGWSNDVGTTFRSSFLTCHLLLSKSACSNHSLPIFWMDRATRTTLTTFHTENTHTKTTARARAHTHSSPCEGIHLLQYQMDAASCGVILHAWSMNNYFTDVRIFGKRHEHSFCLHQQYF